MCKSTWLPARPAKIVWTKLPDAPRWCTRGWIFWRPGRWNSRAHTQAAYKRFVHNTQFVKQQKETKQTMITRRPLWTALAILAVLTLVFTLTPARAWASDFLGLFRVQKVQVVTFDPAAMEDAKCSPWIERRGD